MSVLGKAFDAASKGVGKTASVVGDAVGDAVPQLPSVPKVPWGWIIGAGVVMLVLSQARK